jgi:hypothetical protein
MDIDCSETKPYLTGSVGGTEVGLGLVLHTCLREEGRVVGGWETKGSEGGDDEPAGPASVGVGRGRDRCWTDQRVTQPATGATHGRLLTRQRTSAGAANRRRGCMVRALKQMGPVRYSRAAKRGRKDRSADGAAKADDQRSAVSRCPARALWPDPTLLLRKGTGKDSRGSSPASRLVKGVAAGDDEGEVDVGRDRDLKLRCAAVRPTAC